VNAASTAVVLVGMFAGGMSGGAVGFGVVLVSAPVVALVAPQLLPAVVVAPSMAANGLVAVAERRDGDRRLLGRLLVWQLPGLAVGLWLLTRIGDPDTLALVVAGVVLALVLVGASPVRPARTRVTEAVAASAAGLSGALSGANGPPLAVLMADDDPGLMRATLPAYFLVAQVLLLAGWALTGRLTSSAVTTGLLAVPAALAGAWVGQRALARRLRRGAVRIAVLVLAVAAAVRAVVAG
jgi:uncharacterized membrane protein YfcA